MPCTAGDRDRVREAVAECRARDGVVAADVLEPDAGPRRTWSLELVVEGDGLEAWLLDRLADHDLRALRVTPQGRHTHAVVTA